MADSRLGARSAEGAKRAAWVGAGDPEARLAELACARGKLRRVLAGVAAALVGRKGWEPLGYVRAGDYARERLGLSGRSLHDLARVGRALDGLPRLEAALVSGALPWSKVRLLARFVGPEDEVRWIALARGSTVRALERRVRAVDRGGLDAAGAGPLETDEDGASGEAMETVRVQVGSPFYFKWRRTQAWAARVAGERVSPGTVLEMVAAETFSALPIEAGEGRSLAAPPAAPDVPQAANVCAPQEDEPGERAAGRAPSSHPGPPEAPLPAFLLPLTWGSLRPMPSSSIGGCGAWCGSSSVSTRRSRPSSGT